MGVDITHIIRNNFRNTKDHKAALKYAKETIETLKKKLYLYVPNELFEFRDDYKGLIFRLPIYDVELTLHNGFWQIEPFFIIGKS